MDAILNYGSKSAKEAGFEHDGEKIDTSYYICDKIKYEMALLKPEPTKKQDEFVR